jgi:hypothetical protein
MEKPQEIPELASIDDIGKLVGLSSRRVRQIAESHTITASTRGRFDLRAIVRAVVDDAKSNREADALTLAKARREHARARMGEISAMKAENVVIDLLEHFEVVERISGLILAKLSGLPARVAYSDKKARREVEHVVDQIRAELAQIATEEAARWRANEK